MNPDILIVREHEGFRLLHGQLHLAASLQRMPYVKVEVSGEGEATVFLANRRIHVEKDGKTLPLHRM